MDIAYPDYQNKLNLERMTSGQLNDYISTLGADGETRTKCNTFFLGLAKDAGKTLSRHIATRTARAASRPKRIKPSTSKKGTGKKELPPPTPPAGFLQETAEAQASSLLWALFKRLPNPGSVWPQADRESWTEAAKSVFKLEYKDKAES